MSVRAQVTLFRRTGRSPTNHLVMDYPTSEEREDYFTHFEAEHFLCSVEKTNSIEFVLNLDLSSIVSYNSIDYGKYLDGTREVYFYVTKIEYRNDRFQILHCKIDVFETYFSTQGVHTLPKSTVVTREHKNRWFKFPDGSIEVVVDDFPEAISAPDYLASYEPLASDVSKNSYADGLAIVVLYRQMSFDDSTKRWKPDSAGIPIVEFMEVSRELEVSHLGDSLPSPIASLRLTVGAVGQLAQTKKIEYLPAGTIFEHYYGNENFRLYQTKPIQGYSYDYPVISTVEENANTILGALIMCQESTRSTKLREGSALAYTPFARMLEMPGAKVTARNDIHEPKLLSSQFNHEVLKFGDLSQPIALEDISDLKITSLFSCTHTYALNTSEMEKISLPNNMKTQTQGFLLGKIPKSVYWTETNYEQWLNDFTIQRNAALISSGINIASGVASAVISVSPSGKEAGTVGIVGAMMAFAKDFSNDVATADQKKEQQKRYGTVAESGDPTGFLGTTEAPFQLPTIQTWLVKQPWENAVSDIFYYLGYSCEKRESPNLLSRWIFNYIQAEVPYISGIDFQSKEAEDELKARFADGLEIVHYDYDESLADAIPLDEYFDDVSVNENVERSLYL